MRTVPVVLFSCCLCLAVPGASALVFEGGNGVYRVLVADDEFLPRCGTWTATTGPSHPVGPGRDLLFALSGPASSYTTLRSWATGTNYTTGFIQVCTEICSKAPTMLEPVVRDGVTVGYRLSWTFQEGLSQGDEPLIQLIQEVVVDGPVDGTGSVDNSVVRETHVVRNLGPGPFSFGLRKMWDLDVAFDGGPWFATCDAPDEACDRSLFLSGTGSFDGFYPRSYAINSRPAVATCPAGLIPNEIAGCAGSVPYVVAGTVDTPSALDPPPDPPEFLQFNSWAFQFGECWDVPLVDAAECGNVFAPFNDTALTYYYGYTADTALLPFDGEERSFTQYLAAGSTTCPSVITATADDEGDDEDESDEDEREDLAGSSLYLLDELPVSDAETGSKTRVKRAPRTVNRRGR